MNNQKLIANIAKILVFFTADVNIFMNLLSRLFHLKHTPTQIPPTGRYMLWHVMGANPQAPEISYSHRRDAIIFPHAVLPPCRPNPPSEMAYHGQLHASEAEAQLGARAAGAVSLGGSVVAIPTKSLIHPPG